MSRAARVYAPAPVAVVPGARGAPPAAVGAVAVEAVREDWRVEDRWWTAAPLRRHYYELVLADGRDVVVFRDLEGGGWFRQPS